MKEYKNILIVRTDRLGDLVLTTPAIKAIRDRFPHANISLLISQSTKDLVDGNPYLNEIIVDDKNKIHKGIFGFLKLISLIRSKKFELAIILHTKKRTNFLCFIAGIPKRLGYRNKKFGFLLNLPVKDIRHLGEYHEAQYCLDVLKPLGIETDKLELFVPVKPDSEIWAVDFLKKNNLEENKFITIHVGASDPSKRWPDKFFAVIIEEVIKKYGLNVACIGDSNNCLIMKSIQKLVKQHFIDVSGLISISQLISLLKRSKMLISNDSGPVHIASAVGIPVIAIFTRNQPGINPERWRPLSLNSKVITIDKETSETEMKSHNISFKKSGDIDKDYLELIKPTQVLEAIDSIFKLC